MRSFRTLLVVLAGLLPGLASAADWTHWRGPEQTGVSRERDLPERFSPAKPGENNLVWHAAGYGCRSTPLVFQGRLYFISTVGEGVTEQERLVCMNADTGAKLWEFRFNVFLTSIVSNRLGWTNPAIDPETGNVYVHATSGMLFCFDRDGKILWQHSLTEEYGRVSGYGGRLTTPILDGDLCIIGMVNNSWGDQGKGGNRFVAFDKKTGTVVWWSEPAGIVKFTYYSVPVVANINGQRLLVSGGADGAIHAIKVRTGEKVWSYKFAQSVNASTVVSGNRVYISHGEENDGSNIQGKLICLDASNIVEGKPKLLWEKEGLRSGYASPAVLDGRLYICDDAAKLYCLDAETGTQLWTIKYGRLARGSPVLADGKIYVADVNAHFHILKPGPKKCTELHDQFFPSDDGKSFVETNCTPCIVNGKIYWATRDDFYCIGKPDHKATADPIPPQPPEEPADPSKTPTWLQVVPGDVVLQPGEKVSFTVRTFDKNGHPIGVANDVQWSLPAPPTPPNSKTTPPPLRGALTPEGSFAAAAENRGQQGTVQAKVGKLVASARVRVAPTLPIVLDLDKMPPGSSPAGIINVTGKYVVEPWSDGKNALKKLANDGRPPFARANAYIGLPTMKDYAIQSDILGKEVRGGMPDCGILNSRYYLILDGKRSSDKDETDVLTGGQQPEGEASPGSTAVDAAGKVRRLRILSWEGTRRVYKNVPFDWQPDKWYTLKLSVKNADGKCFVQGKAWPAGEAEPKAWQIEFTDPLPNGSGAPGLYAYTINMIDSQKLVGTEVFYRNISVVPLAGR